MSESTHQQSWLGYAVSSGRASQSSNLTSWPPLCGSTAIQGKRTFPHSTANLPLGSRNCGQMQCYPRKSQWTPSQMAYPPRTDELHHRLLSASSCSPGCPTDSRSKQLPVCEPTSRRGSSRPRREGEAKPVRGSPAGAGLRPRGAGGMEAVQQLREADRRYSRSLSDDAREGPQASAPEKLAV